MKRRIATLILLSILFLSSVLVVPQYQAQASLAAQAATATRTRTRTPSRTPTRTATNTQSPTPSATVTVSPTSSIAPDLTVLSLSLVYQVGYTGSCRQVDAPVALRATVKNIGNADAGPFVTSLGGMTIPGLAAGQSLDVTSSFGYYPSYYNNPGATVTVDPSYYNQVIESNENNNALTMSVPIAPLCTVTPTPTVDPVMPDLIISSVARGKDPNSGKMSGSCYLTAPIYGTTVVLQNIGGVNAGAFSVSLTPSSGQTVTQTVSGLAAGQSVSVWFSTGFGPTMTVVVDSTNVIAESNENNTRTIYPSAGTGTPTGTPPPPLLFCTPTPTLQAPTLTPSPTATGPTPTFTKTPTITLTPSPTSNVVACSPVTAIITAPFVSDGPGTFCWQSSNLGTYINNWNNNSVTLNGVAITNIYVAASSYPPKIGGFWYISYNSSFTFSHFETK